MTAASLGRFVHAIVDPATNNGSDTCPGVITRVWQSPSSEYESVNVRLLRDNAPHACEWRTSVQLHPNRTLAQAAFDSAVNAGLCPPFGRHVYWPASR